MKYQVKTPPSPPPGDYDCQITEVIPRPDFLEQEAFLLGFRVVKGPHFGCTFYYNLTCGDESMPRIKALCRAIGIDTAPDGWVTAGMLRGQKLRVTYCVQERDDAALPFDGFLVRTEESDESS